MQTESALIQPKLDDKTRLNFSAQITHRHCFSENYFCEFLTKACTHFTQNAFNLMKLARKGQDSSPQALTRKLSLKIFTWFMELRVNSLLQITHQYSVGLLRQPRVEVHIDWCNGTCRHDNVLSFTVFRPRSIIHSFCHSQKPRSLFTFQYPCILTLYCMYFWIRQTISGEACLYLLYPPINLVHSASKPLLTHTLRMSNSHWNLGSILSLILSITKNLRLTSSFLTIPIQKNPHILRRHLIYIT